MNSYIREIEAQKTYDLRHQVMWPDKPKEFVKLNNDEKGMHFGLIKNTAIISIVSLFDLEWITCSESLRIGSETKVSSS